MRITEGLFVGVLLMSFLVVTNQLQLLQVIPWLRPPSQFNSIFRHNAPNSMPNNIPNNNIPNNIPNYTPNAPSIQPAPPIQDMAAELAKIQQAQQTHNNHFASPLSPLMSAIKALIPGFGKDTASANPKIEIPKIEISLFPKIDIQHITGNHYLPPNGPNSLSDFELNLRFLLDELTTLNTTEGSLAKLALVDAVTRTYAMLISYYNVRNQWYASSVLQNQLRSLI